MGTMKWEYELLLKSHCDFPDYQDECEAASKIDAAKIFAKSNSLREHRWQDLLPYIDLVKKPVKTDLF